ncbi:S8 family peptidase [Agrobacterium rhizogenes]|nr:S8 family peptidase [Rhizobium rhizogenes]NTG57945.1 S8 family peptidase [Rhizobium rhizogenes]NTH04139.1 S8 family peptidase [Rhizobium rhizogenes]NTI59863.1 S8 family peptidase [Rhizobium rhizogenes]
MAEEPPRPLQHVYLPGHGDIQDYTARSGGGGGSDVPPRDRATHAGELTAALTRAVADAEAQLKAREPELAGGTPGFYLEFELPSSQGEIVDKLENRQGKFPIELVSVRPVGEGRDAIAATVFVPEQQRDYYLKKVAQYRNEDRIQRVEVDGKIVEKNNGPKNEVLVASLDTARLAVARSLYTDDVAFFPEPGAAIWWEVWLRLGTRGTFAAAAQRLELSVREHALQFPEREVLIVHATSEILGRIIAHTDTIAELRTARDTPAFFMEMDGAEQRAWAAETAGRVVAPGDDTPAVCLLDSGSTRRHPLIQPALTAEDQQAFDAGWSVEDVSNQGHGGHGTQLSGVALYGDLTDVLAGNGQIVLSHRLESVKILPDHGANDPDLFGAITAQSIARAEIMAPNRPRAICLALTSDGDHWRGRPSSWSAALDALAYGADNAPRLIAVSAGNIRDDIHQNDYLERNDVTPIESPAQAWNVLTVGAFTEKTALTDPLFNGWGALAPVGDLMPTSRTSVSWNHDWPLKPDVVFEGGNLGVDPATLIGEPLDDLALLTTYRTPENRAFTTTGETSAAVALAARMGARILAQRPNLWAETVRALIVHSAEWTPAMKAHIGAINKNALVRRYGFGVPSIVRALGSLNNDVTMVVESQMQPFITVKSDIETKDMVLHELPWPTKELEALGETQVQLRITLSYFIEPNPGERGQTKRHSYASHGLRFALKPGDERVDVFLRRINAAAGARPPKRAPAAGWTLGPVLRNRGSLHADIWEGNAVELSQRDAIAIYPTGGWWRENTGQKRGDTGIRYALVATLRTAAEVDLYTPISTPIQPEVAPEILIET